ncbi:MAG TPA: hypothetical protein PLB70_06660 [Paludibacteraceae bacterium]|nr:hypothetical protein [Paludibacteraceae bacterium]
MQKHYEAGLNKVPVRRRHRVYTWVHCCNRGINKMQYRYRHYVRGGKEIDEWKLAINYQIQKLLHRHDALYLWGVNEYYNCEKVNQQKFPREFFPNLLWHFKSVEQAADFVKRMRSKRKKLVRSEKRIWDYLIGSTRVRFLVWRPEPVLSDEDEAWHFCFRANRDKLSGYWHGVSWGTRYIKNQRKIEKWVKYECKQIQQENDNGQ